MPAKSIKQARLMRAAEHGADFPKAKAIRASMSPGQIKEFTHTSNASHAYNWRTRKNLRRGKAK